MRHLVRKISGETGWGAPASVVLHLLLVLLLTVHLPAMPAPAPDESLHVELVPPPAPEPKPAEAAPPTPAPPAPQAFESGVAEPQPENKPAPQPELPPAAPEDAKPTPEPTPAIPPSAGEQAEIPAAQPIPPDSVLRADGSPDDSEAAFPLPSDPPMPRQKPAQKPASAPADRKAVRLVKAQKLYTQDVLSHPQVKQALGRLPPKDRIVQICGIEALEQIRRHSAGAFPDMLARDGGTITASSLTVSDGAYRSRSRWYGIDFKCDVDAGTMAVTAFSYATGGPIPESQWAARQLPRD